MTRSWLTPLALAAAIATSACGDGDVDDLQRIPVTVSSPAAYGRDGTARVVDPSSSVGSRLLVDLGTAYQTIDGFGGAFNEQGWDALLDLDEPDRQRALSLLFDPAEGARFVFGRVPIGASDYALSRYTLDDVPGDLALDHFSIARDRRLLIPYIRAATALQPNLRLWGSAWTPPPWMKANNAYDSGSMRDDPQILDAYARYLGRFVVAYREEGLGVEAVHVQNEPAQLTRYPSCLWTPELMRDFVRDYMGPVFDTRHVAAEVWLGTLNYADRTYVDVPLQSAPTRRFLKGIGVQWSALGMVPYLVHSYPNMRLMQTETVCGNHPWEPGFNPDHPPNDHTYGVVTWMRIRDYLAAGVNSYLAWNMVLDTEGKNLDSERPWPQNALLVVDRVTRELRETAAYWAFRHFSGFVDVGARRVGLSGAHEDALAFQNPDGRVVVVLQNRDGAPLTLAIEVGPTVVEVDIPAYGWVTLKTQPL